MPLLHLHCLCIRQEVYLHQRLHSSGILIEAGSANIFTLISLFAFLYWLIAQFPLMIMAASPFAKAFVSIVVGKSHKIVLSIVKKLHIFFCNFLVGSNKCGLAGLRSSLNPSGARSDAILFHGQLLVHASLYVIRSGCSPAS